MGPVIEVGFDYSAIDADGRDDVREAAIRIRLRMSRTVEDIIEIGRDLSNVKAALEHGQFGRWIEAEFGMSVMSASRFMNVAERFGSKINTVIDLAPSVLYALAAPSTDDAIVEEVVDRSARGEAVTRDDVATLKAQWVAERKGLTQALEDERAKAKQAKASQEDFSHRFSEMQSEAERLRDQRDTAVHERDQARKGVFGGTKVVNPVDDAEAVEKQIAAVMSAWNKAGPEARERVRALIDEPVMDGRYAA